MDNACDYYRIPIEVQACQLQSEFDRNAPAFSVEERVRRELGLPEGGRAAS